VIRIETGAIITPDMAEKRIKAGIQSYRLDSSNESATGHAVLSRQIENLLAFIPKVQMACFFLRGWSLECALFLYDFSASLL